MHEFEKKLVDIQSINVLEEDSKMVFCPFYFISKEEICILLTSRELLKNILKQKIHDPQHLLLCINSTYNLNIQYYPLVVLGTNDKNHKFHLIAVAIVNN